MKDNSHKRHIARAVTWRIVGTLDAGLLACVISGDQLIGVRIGGAEVRTKMLLYYLHERVWFRINLTKNGKVLESRKRHLAKTISWRLVGTVDTMLVAWIVSGDPLIGMQVGFAEIATKMLLYYLHERIWYRTSYGLSKKILQSENEQ